MCCFKIKYFILLPVFLTACTKFQPSAPEPDQVLDGPLEELSAEQNAQFLRGDVAFNNEIFTKETGLGPLFVSTSCGSCHAGDGKGHPFSTLTRFGQNDANGNTYLHLGGPQLQHRSLQGFQPEQLPPGVAYTRLMPPANTGLGLLDAVTDATILEMSDPTDKDGDGISGVPNWILPKGYFKPRSGQIMQQGKVIGRFGKKASAFDLLNQTAVAYNEDIGITSMFEPKDTYSGEDSEPEISAQRILDVVFYLKTLKAPIPRNAADRQNIAGKALFMSLHCAGCHKPELKTGYSTIKALSEITFHPFTDLLLHDMGEGLSDGYTEGNAKPAEWRTPALWGLGLSPKSQGGQYFLLHDGRARSLEQAILLHGGEASQSRDKYSKLSSDEKKQILKFLESL